MNTLNRFETAEFLETFHKGILQSGLFEPLRQLEDSGTSLVKQAAQSLQESLVAGATPQVAVALMSPQLPSIVRTLIINGFEQTNIDFILNDIVKAYKSHEDDEHLAKSLEATLDHYSPLKTEAICIECWSSEMQKILKRAQTEQSSQVILSFENGHLVQKFIAVKLVTITEPAIPAVYETLRKSFSDLARQNNQNSLSVEIKTISAYQYQMIAKDQTLKVIFAD